MRLSAQELAQIEALMEQDARAVPPDQCSLLTMAQVSALLADLRAAQERCQRLDKALGLCAAMAGTPDAAQGCRNIIATVKEVLAAQEGVGDG